MADLIAGQGYTYSQVKAFVVSELKTVVQFFQLSTSGSKAELQHRLLSYLESHKLLLAEPVTVEEKVDASPPPSPSRNREATTPLAQATNDVEESNVQKSDGKTTPKAKAGVTFTPTKMQMGTPPPPLLPIPPETDPNILTLMQMMQQSQNQFMLKMMENQQAQMMTMFSSLKNDLSGSTQSVGMDETAIRSRLDWIYTHNIASRMEMVKKFMDENINSTIIKNQVTALREGLCKLEDFLSEKLNFLHEKSIPEIETWFETVCTDVLQLECSALRFVDEREQKRKEEEELKKAGSLPPNVEIPKLYYPDEFPVYWELYDNLIFSNPKVSTYWKFQYLRQGMKGTCKHVLDCIQPLVENFTAAVDLVKERYGQPRKVVRHAVKAIVDSKNATHDAKSLRSSYDTLLAKYRTVVKYQKELDNPLDTVLMPILESKLPIELKEEWERKLIDESCEFSSAESYFDWLSTEVRAKEVIDDSKKEDKRASTKTEKTKLSTESKYSAQVLAARDDVEEEEQKSTCHENVRRSRSKKETEKKEMSETVCLYCDGTTHCLSKCFKFQKLSPFERYEYAKKNFLCFSCLVSLSDKNHGARRCSIKCSICKRGHNDLLHFDSDSESEDSSPDTRPAKKKTGAGPIAVVSQEDAMDTIFPTAKALLSDGVNDAREVRIAFDTMCQRTFITANAASSMKLIEPSPISLEVTGFGNQATSLETKIATFTLSPLTNPKFKVEIRATIKSDQICAKVGPVALDFVKCSHLKDLTLSDQYPREKEEDVDLLIGLDYLFKFFGNDIVRNPDANLPVAIQSIFGYVVLGPNMLSSNRKRKKKEVCNVTTSVENLFSDNDTISLDVQLERFWKIESLGLLDNKKVMTADEKDAIDQLNQSIKYENERYQCSLPTKSNATTLTSNFKLAEKLMIKTEKRLADDPQMRIDYDESIMDYEKRGFAREATPDEIKLFDSGPQYFVPHHAVIRNDSVSTRLRTVFNASSPDPNGNSLNDCLLPGPALQPDLGKVMIRFRCHPVALMGDIQKMFCQTKVDPECYKFQQFLWRSYNLSSKPKRYIMTRLMFGITSSPFLAMGTVRHHLSRPDMQELYENACKLALENTYVDDVCSGGNSDTEVIQLARDLIDVFEKGGWKLTKFVSNSKSVMATIPEEDRLPNLVVNFEENEYGMTKALGVGWNVEKDVFTFSLSDSLLTVKDVETKRSIVSRVSSIFDVFGFYAAFTIRAKIFIQKLWTLKVDWDEPLDEDTIVEYRQWCEELKSLPSIEIPRCVIPGKPKSIELHGFGDASTVAYGSAIYIRIETENDEIFTNLLIAKTRVCPLKTKSMPRLELLAAFTCARLMDYTLQALDLTINEVRYWSDSEIVLAWLDKPSTKWKTFVANRVQEIHDISNPKSWAKVLGQENPADLLSRGIAVDDLAISDLYWHGPSWLSKPKSEWNDLNCEISKNIDLPPEETAISALPIRIAEPFSLILRCEKYMKIVRVAARMLRWLNSARRRLVAKNQPEEAREIDTNERNRYEDLSVEEIQASEIGLLRTIQQKHFQEEYDCLSNGRKISASSKILNLDPKFDEKKKLIVVGGRLNFANLPEEAKFQIILPSSTSEPLVSKIIHHIHVQNCHSPMNVTFSSSRTRFWIIHGRRSVEKTIRACLVCFRSLTHPMEQIMGDLPPERVNISKSFLDIGLDFAGPIFIKVGKLTVKSYIAVFSCAASRLLHLELTMDMTAEEFLLALRRAMNRRGKCKTITSDNQSSFKRADKLLRLSFSDRLLQKLEKSEVERYLADNSIKWTFITEKSPFRGGYWERIIRSVKGPLRKVLGRSLLTYTQTYTLLTDIEAMINQRPLTMISNDCRDDEVLTPAHLALGRPLGDLPDVPRSDEIPISKNFRLLQRLRHRLWLRWSKEYLHSLQPREKWQSKKPEINVGDIVLVSEENTKRNVWPLARVVEVTPSKDGIIRTARVKTAKGFFNRPIQRLHLLESPSKLEDKSGIISETENSVDKLTADKPNNSVDKSDFDIPKIPSENSKITSRKTRSGRSVVKPSRLGIDD